MQNCKFTITTSVEEQENTVVYDGKIDVCDEMIALTYVEDESKIFITLQKGIVLINRQGDYSLRLRLEEGQKTESVLGLGQSEGYIATMTHRVKYSLEGNSFKLSLRYDLIFGENETQKMKLNLKAQIKNR